MIININILIGPCLSLKEMQSQVTADSEIYYSQICNRQTDTCFARICPIYTTNI